MSKEILVVDDEVSDLETMKEILENEGYAVVTAVNGVEALDLIKQNGFNLVLLDIKMPALSGYELLRLMKEKNDHKSKMIYVSIIPEQEVDMNDVDGFIQKPFSPEEFLAKIKEVIGEDE